MEIKKFKINKLISAALYAVAFAWTAWILIDIISSGDRGLGFGIGIMVYLIFSAIANGVSLLPSLFGLIMSIVGVKKGYCEKSTLIYFIVFTLLPIATFFLNYIILPSITSN